MAGPAPNPNVPCDNAVNQPVMAYNIARLEMLALGQTLGQWLRRQENPDFSMEFESEVRILFREYARANPAAGCRSWMARGSFTGCSEMIRGVCGILRSLLPSIRRS